MGTLTYKYERLFFLQEDTRKGVALSYKPTVLYLLVELKNTAVSRCIAIITNQWC
jgi:hypothetical protein